MEPYKNKRILFMGDSITELGDCERGWVKHFKEIAVCMNFQANMEEI